MAQNYEQRQDGAARFHGYGVFRYDAKEDRYELYWFDSMGMAPNVFLGTFEGDVLSLRCDEPDNKFRASFEIAEGADRYTFKMDVSQDGETWHSMMEGTYSKQG